MRKILLLLLLGAVASFATTSKEVFVGMKNSRYAFIGGQYGNYGLSLESSIFVQKAEQQYGRAVIFYKTPLVLNLNICYALFAGTRYDGAFYDVGGKLNFKGSWINERLGLDATAQVSNDSEIGLMFAYEIRGIVGILPEISLFAGARTIPEFRMKEQRFFAGFSFESGRIIVNPEISTPMKRELQLTRVSASFIYKLPL